jgi:hypothetical protein
MKEDSYVYDDTAFLYFVFCLGCVGLCYLVVSVLNQLARPLADRPWLEAALKIDFYREKYLPLVDSRFSKAVLIKALLALVLTAIIVGTYSVL